MGSLMLLDTQSPEFRLPVAVIAAFAVSTAGLTLFAVGAAVKARSAAVRTGREAMLGASVEVLPGFGEQTTGQGRVRAFGEVWQARSTGPSAASAGSPARVVDIDGLTLVIAAVDPAQPESAGGHTG